MPEHADPPFQDVPRWTPVVVIAAFLCLYIVFSAPGITWEDSATYHRIARSDDHPWGSASSYRLYFILLKGAASLPWGETPWRLNLLHSFLSAGCLGVFYLLVHVLTRDRFSGICAVCALGISHLFWHYAEVTKVYPLMNLLLLTSLTGLAIGSAAGKPWGWTLSGLAFGASLGAHPYVAAALPGILVWLMFAPHRRQAFSRWLAAFACALAPVCMLYLDRISILGPIPFLKDWALGGQGEMQTGLSQGHELLTVCWKRLPLDLVEWGIFLGYQFALSLPLAWLGLRRSLASGGPVGLALVALYVAYVAVPFDFNVPLKINFYLPSFLIVAVWIGLGVRPFLERLSERVPVRRGALGVLGLLLFCPVCLYAAFTFGFLERERPDSLYPSHDASYKDRGRFYFWPGKRGFDEPRRYAESVSATTEPDATLVVDFQEADVLRYFQEEDVLHYCQSRKDLFLFRRIFPTRRIHHIPRWKEAEIFRAEVLGLWTGRPLYLGKVYRPLWRDAGWAFRETGPFDRITFPFSWEEAHRETARVPSPKREADAVIVEIHGGTTVSCAHKVYLVPPGGDWRRRDPVASFYAAVRPNGASGVSGRWTGSRFLTIEYRSARSATVHALHPRVGDLEFSITFREEGVGD